MAPHAWINVMSTRKQPEIHISSEWGSVVRHRGNKQITSAHSAHSAHNQALLLGSWWVWWVLTNLIIPACLVTTRSTRNKREEQHWLAERRGKKNKEKEYKISMRIKEDKLFPENLTHHLQPGGVGWGGNISTINWAEEKLHWWHQWQGRSREWMWPMWPFF